MSTSLNGEDQRRFKRAVNALVEVADEGYGFDVIGVHNVVDLGLSVLILRLRPRGRETLEVPK